MENNDAIIDLTYASSIENVDFALYEWIDQELNLSCNSKDGFKKVPVLWVTPERAFQVKQNKEFRDINGTLNIPLITIERTGIVKDQKLNGTYFANLPNNNRHIIAKKINQKKTAEFTNADLLRRFGSTNFIAPRKNDKIVYEFSSMLLPVYANFTYSISLFTQFQQQMNELVQPFLERTGSNRYFLIKRDGYKYECFIETNFDTKNNVSSMEEEERRYITTLTIKVLANLVSSGANQEDKIIKTYENAVNLKLPKDSLIVPKNTDDSNKNISELFSNTVTDGFSETVIKKNFLIGDGLSSTYKIIHNLNKRNLTVLVKDKKNNSIVDVKINYTDANFINIDMGKIIDKDSYYVTIIT